MSKPLAVCFGEVLWDVFPDREVIGGAPLNVAMRLQSMGCTAEMLSGIGQDEKGRMLLDHMQQHGVGHQGVYQHPTLPTGTVTISLDSEGSASYIIDKPVAWDAIHISPSIVEQVKNSQLFVFGSLAVRGAFNQNILNALLKEAPYKVFDVNLRKPDYSHSMVYELMQHADFVKMNDEELEELCEALGGPLTDLKKQAEWMAAVAGIDTLCITRGKDGAMLLRDGTAYAQAGFSVQVMDTVGAGDSFLATLLDALFVKNLDEAVALERACAVGALVASKAGANAVVSEGEIKALIDGF